MYLCILDIYLYAIRFQYCFGWLGATLQVNERESLWENPHAAAASWKPCAERRSDEISGKSSI
jgi:hypothetical protein